MGLVNRTNSGNLRFKRGTPRVIEVEQQLSISKRSKRGSLEVIPITPYADLREERFDEQGQKVCKEEIAKRIHHPNRPPSHNW
jgi:hypothetical protein